MRKYIRVFAVMGLLAICLLFTAAYAASIRGSYYGLISCAERQRLPYMHGAVTFELLAFSLFVSFGAFRQFLLSGGRINTISARLSIAMAVNILALAYKILEFPIVLRRDGIFSAVEEGSMRSPLFLMGLLHAILAIGWINHVLKDFLRQKQRQLGSLMLLLLIVAGIIFYMAVQPVRCFG